MRTVFEGLQILLKYAPDGEFCAEHDEVFAGHDVPPAKMEADDVTKLKALGWSWDKSLPSWKKFV